MAETHEVYCRLQNYKVGASCLGNSDENILKTREKNLKINEWKKRKDKSFRKLTSLWSIHRCPGAGSAAGLGGFFLFFIEIGHEHQLP